MICAPTDDWCLIYKGLTSLSFWFWLYIILHAGFFVVKAINAVTGHAPNPDEVQK